MANKITIDVEARFVDNISDKSKDASESIDKLGKEAQQTQKQVDKLGKTKAKPIFDADNSKLLHKLKSAEDRAKRLGRTKTQVVLTAMDKATNVIGNVLNKAHNFAGRVFSATVRMKDNDAVKTLTNIGKLTSDFSGKVFRGTLKLVDYATTPLRKIKNALFSIKGLIAGIATAWAANKLLMQPVSVADAYSSAKISFSTLLGEQEGQQMMDDLDVFAKKTPFNTTNVISNSQKMLAMGWDAEDIIKDMEVIGNAAAATGKLDQGLESIVRAMSQIKTKGRLSTEELNQLAEAGIAAKAMLAEQLGYGTGDKGIAAMTEDLEDGAIASDEAIQALLQGMKKYDGMMDSMANETVEGLFSQIKDTFDINIVRKWGQGLQDGAKKGFGSFLDLLDNAEDGLARVGDMLYDMGSKISNWGADKLKLAVATIEEITGTQEFKDASIGGKIKILWDGIVADPIKDWWNHGGKEKTAETAGKIGSWLGKTLSDGLLAIFGATDVLNGGGEDVGGSVAKSFVKGFTDNFDGSAVTDAFVDAIKNIWSALPTWAKFLIGGTLVGKGAGLIGNALTGISTIAGGASNLLGGFTIGNSALPHLTGTGTGLAGLLGKAGVAMGAGTAGTAVLAGGGLVAGGLTAVSGAYDLYKGLKEDDSTKKKSGAWKIGGAAGGAAAGAAIGTALGGPLVGTAIGALVGSGIGWWQSNKLKKAAEENAKAIEEQAIAEQNAAYEAAKLKVEMEELAAEDMAKHFGDITLSAEEMQKEIRRIIGGKLIDNANDAKKALDQLAETFQAFDTEDYLLKKNLWLSSVQKDAKLTKDEMSNLKSASKSFGDAAKSYVSDAQFAATESVTALLGNSKEAEKLIESTNKYYGEQSDEITKLTKELDKKLADALSDNVISVDEQKSIDKLRTQISNIIRKLQEEEYEAKINILEAKYGGKLTTETFKEAMSGAVESAKTLEQTYYDNYGQSSIGKNDEEKKTLKKGLYSQLTEVWSNTGDYGLGTMFETYDKELGILGDKFSNVISKQTIPDIKAAAGKLTKETKASISSMIETMAPTTEQIEGLVNKYKELGMEPPKALTDYLNTVEFYEALAKGPEAIEEFFANETIDIDPKLRVANPDIVKGEKELEGIFSVEANVETEWHYDAFDKEWISPDGKYSFTTQALVDAGWTYDSFNKEWISPDGKYTFKTDAYVNADYTTDKFNSQLIAPASNYSFSTTANVSVKYKISGWTSASGNIQGHANKMAQQLANDGFITGNARGNIIYPFGSNAPGYADGGMVQGGSRLVKVAEEGTPEMIIPLGKHRRDRAMMLWREAGEMMDVPGFARGGLTRNNYDEGIRFHGYTAEDSATTGGQTVKVDVGGIQVEIHIDANGQTDIVEAIRAQAPEIAEAVAGPLADAISAMFENTPTKGGAA